MELASASCFKLEPDEEYDQFCGKVFLTTKRNIVVHCVLCESKYHGFNSFMDHITRQHLAEPLRVSDESFESEDDYESPTRNKEEVELPIELQEKKITSNLKREKNKTNPVKKSTFHERTLPVITEIEIRSRPTQVVASETGLFACPCCPQRFPLEYLLKAHVKGHDENRSFKCSICGAQCKSHGRLRQHMRRHEKNKPYQCHLCKRSFVNQSELKYHIRNHNGEKPFQCEDCGLLFAYRCTLRMHRKRHHTFQKDYVCPICTQVFSYARFLRIYIAKHTNEPSYECEICGKKFKTSSCFGRHKTQHRQQEESEKEKNDLEIN